MLKVAKDTLISVNANTDLIAWFDKRFQDGAVDIQYLVDALLAGYEVTSALWVFTTFRSLCADVPQAREKIITSAPLIMIMGSINAVDIHTPGAVYVAGSLSADCNVTAKSINANGIVADSMTVTNDIYSRGVIAIRKNLFAGGSIETTNGLHVQGDANFKQLQSQRSVVIEGNLHAMSVCSFKDIVVRGDARIHEYIAAGQRLEINGKLKFTGPYPANVSAGFTLSGGGKAIIGSNR